MNRFSVGPQQRGMALVISLLFLLILTVIGVVAATNSKYALQMSLNSQDTLHSFQAAEAGIYAALATACTPSDTCTPSDEDLFSRRVSTFDAFGAMSDEESPLGLLETGASSVTTDVILTSSGTACPRRIDGSSVGLFDCDYYRIESEHAVERRARTRVNMGVVKTVISEQLR